MEHPSAAPTPLSRKIFWACSKFGALNNALVMKCLAKNHEIFTWNSIEVLNYSDFELTHVFFQHLIYLRSMYLSNKQDHDDCNPLYIPVNDQHNIVMWIFLPKPRSIYRNWIFFIRIIIKIFLFNQYFVFSLLRVFDYMSWYDVKMIQWFY